uniref:Uncharacterized protein n=1 Tax=Dulem virus 42 TaxID=3145760 RepID=A0AAU8B7R7_9CAUD
MTTRRRIFNSAWESITLLPMRPRRNIFICPV